MVDFPHTSEAENLPEQNIFIDEKPLKWCTVSLGDVFSRGTRLEAGVFDVEAKQARDLIAHGKYPIAPIGGPNGMASSYVCGRFKRIWVKKSDLPIYQPSAIADIKPAPDGYISPKTRTDIEALRVHKGQVLMTCSGTIGKVSYVSETLNGKIFSHDLLRIDCHHAEDAGYLYTYLKSRTGSKILLTNSYGAVITHIEPEHLATVPIPYAPLPIREKIHNLIIRSFELRDESNALIDEATALMLTELHLPDFDTFAESLNGDINTEAFNVTFGRICGRLDASYHLPIVDAIVGHLKRYAEEVTTVGDSRVSEEVFLPGRFKRVYVDEGYGKVLIGGKQLHELDPTGKKYLSAAKHGKMFNNLEVRENTVLITRSGTIGKIALVPKHWEHWIPSDHIIRIVPADREIAGYLSIFLASDYGYQLITRFTYGAVVDEIDDNHVRAIPIPLLKNHEVQLRINELALEANRKRYEAYLLEETAGKVLDEEVIYAKNENRGEKIVVHRMGSVL